MKLALTGAHSTGKTSVLEACERELARRRPGEFFFIREVARQVISLGLPLNREATIESYIEYIRLQLEQERRAEGRPTISDRSLVDLLAYIRVNANPEIPATFVKMVEEIVRLECRFFDLFCYLPIEFEVANDGIRPSDHAYQYQIDAAVRHIFSEFGLPMVRVAGTVDERCRVVIRFLERED